MIVETKINPNKFYNRPFAYSDDSSRVFYSNAILLINSGTLNVKINDIFLLIPGASLELNGNQNEVDATVYKFSFASGAGTKLLQGWLKYDAGISGNPPYAKDAFYTKEKPKKVEDKKRLGEKRARKGEKNNKYNSKLKADF